MSYAMENVDETKRLEAQAKQKGYLLEDELKDVPLPDVGQFLDAGCGSGLLSRFLYERSTKREITAVDLSELRLEQAERTARNLGYDIKFQQENLEQLSFSDNIFDVVICRYVMEHVTDPNKLLREFMRVLKPGGKLVVINFDGIVVNMHSRDHQLQQELKHLTTHYPGDLYIARKLPTLFDECAFRKIHWSAQCQTFDDNEREVEAANTRDRFHFAQEFLEQIFGGRAPAAAFKERYFKALQDPNTTLFYTKFVIQGLK